MNKRKPADYILLLLLVLVVFGMLYFGFRLKGFRPANNAQWAVKGPGIAFGRFGIAYTDPIDLPSAAQDGLTVEIAILPGRIGTGIHFVLLANNGDDAQQLLIGQWLSKLIVMNGDDYENRTKSPMITAEIGRMRQYPVLVSVVSGDKGTRLYLNGELKTENTALDLQWPGNRQGVRLILGNSVFGHHSWRGTIEGLAIYTHELNRRKVGEHYRSWREHGDFGFAAPDAPAMLYLLNEGAGDLAHDRSGNGHHLNVPDNMKILRKEVLTPPWHMGRWQWNYELDAVLNFIGFWPLGFLVAAVLARSRSFEKHHLLFAVLSGFVFSLCIEVGQAWIPSRSSSLLDLILNTSGTAVGALVYASQRRWIARRFFGSN